MGFHVFYIATFAEHGSNLDVKVQTMIKKFADNNGVSPVIVSEKVSY